MRLRNYPDRFEEFPKRQERYLKDGYTFRILEVSDAGDVLNPPEWNGKDHFVSLSRHGDLECLLKPLPAKLLAALGMGSSVNADGLLIRRPRPGRDDQLSITNPKGGKRGTYIYGANYLVKGRLGREPTTEQEFEAFLGDYRRFVDLRPSVPLVAKAMMREYLHGWHNINREQVPPEVLRAFYKYGRGGMQDVSVIGTRTQVKVDQTMAYLSALCLLHSPAEDVTGNHIWLNDGLYDAEDSFGIYCADIYISETLRETPIYKDINDVTVPVRGHCKEVVVLKPTMDNVKSLEVEGLARVEKIHWCWRFKARSNHRPFKVLYDKLLETRKLSRESTLFWKLVACAIWGMTLQTYKEYDEHGKPCWVGGFWFNPVLGFTTTDLIRAKNFQMKMRSRNMGAEVVDMVLGPDGDWYVNESVKVKGPYDYTSINNQLHVAKEDDKNNILGRLQDCKQTRLKMPVKGRRTFLNFRWLSATHAKELFGVVNNHDYVITHSSRRKEPSELHRLPMKDLVNSVFLLDPYTETEAIQANIQCETDSDFELLVVTDVLAEFLESGKTW